MIQNAILTSLQFRLQMTITSRAGLEKTLLGGGGGVAIEKKITIWSSIKQAIARKKRGNRAVGCGNSAGKLELELIITFKGFVVTRGGK